MRVLITGFDAFGKDDYNPTFEAIKLMDTANNNLELVKLELPTKFIAAKDQLLAHLDKNTYDAIILTGQAAGRSEVTLEKYTLNIMNSKIEDNDQYQPRDQVITTAGPDLYASGLDLSSMASYLSSNDIPSSISYHAGTFVCNSTYYSLLNYIKEHKLSSQGLFVHVPIIDQQVKNYKADTPFVSLEHIVKAFETIIKFLENNL